MPAHDPAVVGAERPRGGHEIALAQRQHLAADDPRVGDPAGRAEHDNEVEQARAEDGEHGHREHEHRKRELHVTQAHQDIVDPSAVPAADQPERDAEHAGDQHRGEADHERDARAVQQTAGDVAAERVGPQRMLARPRGRREPLEQCVLDRITGRQRRRRHREHDGRGHDQRAGDGERVDAPHVSRTRGSATV